MEKGCFGLGIITSDRAKIGGQARGDEATSQPTGVVEQEAARDEAATAPTHEKVKAQIRDFIGRFSKQSPRADTLRTIYDRFDLDGKVGQPPKASPEARARLSSLLEHFRSLEQQYPHGGWRWRPSSPAAARELLYDSFDHYEEFFPGQ